MLRISGDAEMKPPRLPKQVQEKSASMHDDGDFDGTRYTIPQKRQLGQCLPVVPHTRICADVARQHLNWDEAKFLSTEKLVLDNLISNDQKISASPLHVVTCDASYILGWLRLSFVQPLISF